MPSLSTPTALEKVTSNVVTESLLTVVGALLGTPMVALLPALSNSLASGRQQKRVESALTQIDAILNAHEEALRNLTDSQYKLINEAILALLQTTSPEKIEYLRRAVHNSLDTGEGILAQEAVVLARIVRDISADEADFLVKNFHYERIQLASASSPDDERNVLTVAPDSQESIVITGLVSLGLLLNAESTWDRMGFIRFSPIVAKLLALLREPTS